MSDRSPIGCPDSQQTITKGKARHPTESCRRLHVISTCSSPGPQTALVACCHSHPGHGTERTTASAERGGAMDRQGAPHRAGIHHLKRPVTDLARSREWYRSRLGYQVQMEFIEQGTLMGYALTH